MARLEGSKKILIAFLFLVSSVKWLSITDFFLRLIRNKFEERKLH